MIKKLGVESVGGIPVQKKEWSSWYSFLLSENTLRQGKGLRESAIIIVERGILEVSVDKFRNKLVGSGEMFLIPPGCPYVSKIIQDAKLTVCRFRVESLLNESYSIHELSPYYNDIQYDFNCLQIQPVIREYLSLLGSYLKDGIGSSRFFELKQQEFFFLLFSLYAKEELAAFLYPVIGDDTGFKEFVMSNHYKVKNVQELALLANYSQSGFIKKFQKSFKEPPYKWMQEQKAKQILPEIIRGVKPLQEIAMEYHFSSYQHFADFCKTWFGFPPTEIAGRPNTQKRKIVDKMDKKHVI